MPTPTAGRRSRRAASAASATRPAAGGFRFPPSLRLAPSLCLLLGQAAAPAGLTVRATQYVRVGDRGVAEGPVLERVRRWTRRADPHRDLQEERRQGGRGPVLPVPEAGHSSARPLPGRVELQLQLRRRPLVTVESVCCPYQPSGLRLRHPNPGPHRPVCGRGEERRADGDVRADAAASAEADPKGESAVHRIALHLHLELPVPGGPGPVLLREVLRQRRALQLHQRVDLPELVGFAGGGRARARGRGRERRETRHDQA